MLVGMAVLAFFTEAVTTFALGPIFILDVVARVAVRVVVVHITFS